MLGWAIGFFFAALIAAALGFGGWAAAFTGVAVIMFWVFVALFVLALVLSMFGWGRARWLTGSGSTFAKLAFVATIALLTYAWVDNGMSTERVSAQIEQGAVQLAESTSDALPNQ